MSIFVHCVFLVVNTEIPLRLSVALKDKNMANEYLIEKKYPEGRIKAFADFKDYLTTNFNPRLPRRIRQTFEIKS